MAEAVSDTRAAQTLVVGAWMAWFLVVAWIAWLMLVRAPHTEALAREANLALPALTEWALTALAWGRAHGTLVITAAVLPLVVLLVARRLAVAVVALSMTFCAGALAGAVAVALWLPERVMERARSEILPMPVEAAPEPGQVEP